VLYSPLKNLKPCLEIALKHHLPLLCLATIIGYLPLSAIAASYTFTTLNAPGAVNGTIALSINDSGQIAGYDFDASGNNVTDSFVATPTNATTPIPSAIWLVGSALASLIGLGRRHV